MMRILQRTFLAAVALAAVLALMFTASRAQSGQAQPGGPQAAPSAPAVKKAPEQFKNIKVLTEMDAEKLVPTMNFFVASLGVQCEFCHVQEKAENGNDRLVPEKDDKREKVTARKMIQMTLDINKTSFNGNRNVTCNTCHRGSANPVPVPAVLETEGERPQPPANAAPAAAPPTVDQILAKYMEAIGGAEAVGKITTRMEKGNVIVGQNSTPIDIYMKAPNKRVSVSHGRGGDSFTAYDGTAGWLGGGRGSRDMNSIDSMSAMVDAALAFPASLKQVFPQMRAFRPDKIGDREVNVIQGRGPGAPGTRLFFDAQTGLLVRVIRYNEAGMGVMPVQVDYSDYRAVDGVKVPHHWTLARPGGRFSIQIDSVQQNVPIDDSKFMKPVAPPTPAGGTPPTGH